MPTVLTAVVVLLSAFAWAAAPHGRVFFVNLKNGDTIAQKSTIKFGVEGMSIVPAGQAADDKTKGHHHLLIDQGPIQAGELVGADATHIHFGKGQTETEVTLSPGKHKLTLQFADGAHRSYGEAMSASVQVTVR